MTNRNGVVGFLNRISFLIVIFFIVCVIMIVFNVSITIEELRMYSLLFIVVSIFTFVISITFVDHPAFDPARNSHVLMDLWTFLAIIPFGLLLVFFLSILAPMFDILFYVMVFVFLYNVISIMVSIIMLLMVASGINAYKLAKLIIEANTPKDVKID